ncbi:MULTISPECIES: insulinase family protein [unclassified Streptomyces]|uniref:insulinase family protein n=1 Tax=unclassified Streptomyces TaxID=2593676 RepID=UPI0037F9FBC9
MSAPAVATVDLHRGHDDEPAHQRGLGALVARVLADPRCSPAARLAADRGFRTRHRLDAHRSTFFYWSADGDAAAAAQALPQTLTVSPRLPDADLITELRTKAQEMAARRSDDPLRRLSRAWDQAAWGTSDPDPMGDTATLARLTPELVLDELERALSTTATPPAGRPAIAQDQHHRPPWQGGVRVVPGQHGVARIGVRIPVTRPPRGALEVLVEALGTGAEGRLHRALRQERSLAYGFSPGHWSRGGHHSLGATAYVQVEDTVEAARTLLATLRETVTAPVPETELSAARARCRAKLLAALDDPFGPAEEARRAALGQPLLADLAHAIAQPGPAPALGTTGERLALAVVGSPNTRQLAALERLLEAA